MDWTSASVHSRSPLPACGAQPTPQQPWQVGPELRPYSDLPHPLPLPCPVALAAPGKKGQRLPPPQQAAASIPCPSPTHPGWAVCRLQAAPGSECPALCPGRDTEALSWLWPSCSNHLAPQRGLESRVCGVSGLQEQVCICSLTGGPPVSVLAWAWPMLSCCHVPRKGQGVGLVAGKFLGVRPAFFFTLINLFIWSVCGGGAFRPSGPWKCCPGVQDAWRERAAFPGLQPQSLQVALLAISQNALKRGVTGGASWQAVSILH